MLQRCLDSVPEVTSRSANRPTDEHRRIPPEVFEAPSASPYALVTPLNAVNELPKSAEWNKPASVETQISPVIFGCAAILTGVVELPSLAALVKVVPPEVET